MYAALIIHAGRIDPGPGIEDDIGASAVPDIQTHHRHEHTPPPSSGVRVRPKRTIVWKPHGVVRS
jgi:hypothetical protein